MEYFNQETERVILRKLTMSDVEKWTGFFVDNQMLKFVGVDMSKSPNPSGARLQRVPTYLINENKAFATRVI